MYIYIVKTKIKIFFSAIIVLLIIFIATPAIYINTVFGNTISVSVDEQVKIDEQKEIENYNIEKINAPVYYTVFKLILNFLPAKRSAQNSSL